MQWYGHVARRDESYVSKNIEKIGVGEKEKKRQTKSRWENCVNTDIREKGLRGG